MSTILAIDPGNIDSAYVLLDAETARPLSIAKAPNAQVLAHVAAGAHDELAVEMIASYGMAVGREVFDTCVWIGRFLQANDATGRPSQQVYRKDVKLHLCHTAAAKDPNVTQALIDRFAYGAPNKGKGSKGEPGWFYGFAHDIWQAYAVGVLVADERSLLPQLAGAR